MGWVTLSLRQSALQSRVFDLEYQLMIKQQELTDLQEYAASIADGTISTDEMMNCPSSLFGTTMSYMVNSSGVAYDSATTKTNTYLNTYGQIDQQTGGQYIMAANGTAQQINSYEVF